MLSVPRLLLVLILTLGAHSRGTKAHAEAGNMTTATTRVKYDNRKGDGTIVATKEHRVSSVDDGVINDARDAAVIIL